MRDVKAQLTRCPRTSGSRKGRFRASSALSVGGTAVQHDQLSKPLSRRSYPNAEPGGPRGRRPGHSPLATALYARTDDLLKCCPERAPWRPAVGITPRLSDAELLTLAVMQALLGFVSEARWLRYARKSLRGLFPYLPGQSGYNKRLRKLAGTPAAATSRRRARAPGLAGRPGAGTPGPGRG